MLRRQSTGRAGCHDPLLGLLLSGDPSGDWQSVEITDEVDLLFGGTHGLWSFGTQRNTGSDRRRGTAVSGSSFVHMCIRNGSSQQSSHVENCILSWRTCAKRLFFACARCEARSVEKPLEARDGVGRLLAPRVRSRLLVFANQPRQQGKLPHPEKNWNICFLEGLPRSRWLVSVTVRLDQKRCTRHVVFIHGLKLLYGQFDVGCII